MSNQKNFNNATNATNTTKFGWIDRFAAHVSAKTGYSLKTEDVHSDEHGWFYYIQARSLVKNHPLFLIHYRGPSFVVIPYDDYVRLEKGECDPVTYVDNAKWNFGYYWGGGSTVGGAFWQPLEEGFGITDKDKVFRYLTILSCRTHRKSSGVLPNEDKCRKCDVSRCPFSPFEEKNAKSNWNNEVKEHDYRADLFLAVSKRVEKELRLKVRGAFSYVGQNARLVPNGIQIDTCSLYLPVDMLNDILYNPGKRDWDMIASEFLWELGLVSSHDKAIIDESDIDCTPAEYCRDFWDSYGYIEFNNDFEDEVESEVVVEAKKKCNWLEKVKSIFKK